jgi:hypothetical protein
VISGSAPAGATLRLTRAFDTKTSKYCALGVDPVVTVAGLPDALACPGGWQDPQTLHDSLDSTTVVPSSGTFAWHVNQSTRPFVGGGATIDKLSDTSSRTDTFTGGGAANSTPGSGTEDRDFTITPDDNASAVKVDVSWGTPEDYDLEVYRKNADGSLTEVGSSGNSPGQPEEVILEGDKAAPGNYVLRVVNFAAAVGTCTMNCEVGGQVVRSTQVFIARGQTLSVDPCSAATPAVVNGSSGTPVKAKPKPKPHKKAGCTAKAKRKHGKARKRALSRCRAAAHKRAKRSHT